MVFASGPAEFEYNDDDVHSSSSNACFLRLGSLSRVSEKVLGDFGVVSGQAMQYRKGVNGVV